MKDGSLLSFLKPKATPVLSTVQDAGPAMIRASDHIHPSLASHQSSLSRSHMRTEYGSPALALGIQKTGNEFIKRFEEIIKSLPENVPIGSRNDKLAAFNIEPALLDNPETNANDLWEVVINWFLKEHLEWGKQLDMGKLICHGEHGMDGVLQFAKYFIEKGGVSVDLFEGKLSHLLGAAESLCIKFHH